MKCYVFANFVHRNQVPKLEQQKMTAYQALLELVPMANQFMVMVTQK